MVGMQNGPRLAVVIAPQSYDYITETTGAGSKARLEVAEQVAQINRGANPLILFPQGFSKDRVRYPSKKGQQSLGENLAKYLRSRPGMEKMRIFHEALSWTTKCDIMAVCDMIHSHGYQLAHVHLVSDSCHIWRVKLAWWLTHPKGWTAEFHTPQTAHATPATTAFQMSKFERYIREPGGFVVYALTLTLRLLVCGRYVPGSDSHG